MASETPYQSVAAHTSSLSKGSPVQDMTKSPHSIRKAYTPAKAPFQATGILFSESEVQQKQSGVFGSQPKGSSYAHPSLQRDIPQPKVSEPPSGMARQMGQFRSSRRHVSAASLQNAKVLSSPAKSQSGTAGTGTGSVVKPPEYPAQHGRKTTPPTDRVITKNTRQGSELRTKSPKAKRGVLESAKKTSSSVRQEQQSSSITSTPSISEAASIYRSGTAGTASERRQSKRVLPSIRQQPTDGLSTESMEHRLKRVNLSSTAKQRRPPKPPQSKGGPERG